MRISIGREFEREARNFYEIQKETLFWILRKNADTEYGRRYNFREIKTIEEFKERVPLTDYSDYRGYISRMIKNQEKNLITEDEVKYYAVSSGTTGEPKYFPAAQLAVLYFIKYGYLYSYEVIGSFCQNRVNVSTGLRGKLFVLNEIRCKDMEGGARSGIISGIPFDFLRQKKALFFRRYTSPPEVMFPEEEKYSLDAWFYLKLRFALECENVEGIMSVFVHQILGHMKYMEDNWKRLTEDIAGGTILKELGISKSLRKKLQKYLSPKPERAQLLSREFLKGFDTPIVPRIWKNAKFIMAIGGKVYKKYMDKLKRYTGDIPYHCFIYGSSEGFFAACREMGDKGEYMLIPDMGYYEFLEQEGGGIISSRELKKGHFYEIIFTSYWGLYRYKMDDVVEIADFYHDLPVFKFAYRRSQGINIAGEKMSLECLDEAVKIFEGKYSFITGEFCIYPDEDSIPGRYVFLLEIKGEIEGNLPRKADGFMDEILKSLNIDYEDCRNLGEIGKPGICFLKCGAFREYGEMLKDSGTDTGQLKPVRILNTEKKKEFFYDRIIF